MRGGRTLIIVGFLVLLGAAVVGVIMFMNQPEESPMPVSEEGTPTGYTPEDMTEIVVAAQDIPMSTRITKDAVALDDWPKDTVPDGALTKIADALDRIARQDIAIDTPITEDMLTEPSQDTVDRGSDVALRIPAGKVAYALPVSRYSSVAWAIQPGDHVDVLISMLLLDLDEEFQSVLPNLASCVEPPEGEGCESGTLGRMTVLNNGWIVAAGPSEDQRPRMVTQMTVQDAVVLRVGEWSTAEKMPPEGEEGEEGREGAQAETSGETEGSGTGSKPLTLIVTPQDAMVLKYAEESGASIDMILRSANDRDKGVISTESVTLKYIFDRFNIELPTKLPYGVTPPVHSLRHNSEEGRLGTGSQRLPEEVILQEAE